MSSDGGAVWTMLEYYYQEGGALIVHPESSHILFTGGMGNSDSTLWAFQVSVSRDSGNWWTRYDLSDSLSGWCHALAVAPGLTTRLFAGGEVDGAGAVYRSTDLGSSWSRVGSPPQTVLDLAVDPGDPDRVYAAADEIYLSTDAGATWTWVQTGTDGFRTIRFHPRSPDTIVVGGSNGIAISTDGGTTWSAMNHGLETDDVAWLEFTDSGDRLLAATLGRACYEWSFLTGMASEGTIAGRRHALKVRPSLCRGAAVLPGLRADRMATVRLRDAAGRTVWQTRYQGTELRLDLRAQPAGVYWLEVEDGSTLVAARLVRI